MKVKLGVTCADQVSRDIAVECDVGIRVTDVAYALVRSRIFGVANAETLLSRRQGHLTLLGDAFDGRGWRMLDPTAAMGSCGLQSGWQVAVAPEFPVRAPRVHPIVGTVEVMSGGQQGAKFSLLPGVNTIGRDLLGRVVLEDKSVSRKHALIKVWRHCVLSDLGSVNGIEVGGYRVKGEMPITQPTDVMLGEVQLRITPAGAVASGESQQAAVLHLETLSHRYPHTRSPRLEPTFPHTSRTLPQPPRQSSAARIPLLAMLAPMLLGGVMFAVTRSSISLLMMAFTPLMMVTSWFDTFTAGTRKFKQELRRFTHTLAAERAELASLQLNEIRARTVETPNLVDIAEAIRSRSGLLWTRRPEHKHFLELRFGDGSLPSRTKVQLPERQDAAIQQWNALREVQQQFAMVAPVPVLERLDEAGAIGVSGDAEGAAGLARALVLQLAGLRSPAELTISAFVGSAQLSEEWEWLKWLPHIDPVGSPVAAWQLADHANTHTGLLASLETVIQGRRGRSPLPVVVCLVLDRELTEPIRSRLIAVAEDGADAGVHVIWVADQGSRIPAACRSYVEVTGEAARTGADAASPGEHTPGTANFVRQARAVPLSRIEYLSAPDAAILARSLAPVYDTAARLLDESDLPQSVQLSSLHDVDVLGGGLPIMQNWQATGTLMSSWRHGEDRAAVRLAAVVGQGAEGPTVIDLRAQGPHALVGGTTGAGKSEFLQTWIMSLAATVSPDRLTFLLVDYKGGSAFAECVDLPHTVGLVTDLNTHLVRRALTSLKAELRYREELLAQHQAKDLITMERRGDPATPPVLVIVIDEFAALAQDVPEFIDGVIDIAQRGRSLGLHLILATQRPSGVITDNLRANTNLRVALRMADEADSSDVVGVKDAAFFDAETPGRGAIKSAAGRITHFQTGYLGGHSVTQTPLNRVAIRELGFIEGEPWDLAESVAEQSLSDRSRPASAARDIERLRDGIIAAAAQAGVAAPRQPWLAALPELISLEELQQMRAGAPAGVTAGGANPGENDPRPVLIGLRDLPRMQRQEAVDIDLDRTGNIAMFGASGTGKTSALISFSASVSAHAETDPVHLYAIDAAGGELDLLRVLPTVGTVATLSDTELMRRVLHHLQQLVRERGPRFTAARATGLGAYRRVAASSEPRIVLLLDGFAAFRQATEMMGGLDSPLHVLAEIMQTGRSVGVHVVLTTDRAGSLPGFLAASVQQQLVLRLAATADYAYLQVPADTLEQAVPGRAVFAGESEEVQLALIGGALDLLGQSRALTHIAERLSGRLLVHPPRVRHAPKRVFLRDLPAEASDLPVFGLDTQELTPVALPDSGLAVVAGPAGSGLSTAALACVSGLVRWAKQRDETVERVLLSFVPERMSGLARWCSWDRLAQGAEQVETLARTLTLTLGGTLAGASSAPERAAAETSAAFPKRATHGVIVIERANDAEGTGALAALVALAKAARRAEVLVLFECEQGTTAGTWELLTALKQPRWGLALQPDEGTGAALFRENFGRITRADFPPGRGFAVAGGKVTPVQVALPDQVEPPHLAHPSAASASKRAH